MRQVVRAFLVAALVLGATGCLPLWRKSEEPDAKRALGIDDPSGRLRTTTPKDLEADMARSRAGLSLRISTNKTEYKFGDSIILDVRLINVSGRGGAAPRDVFVYFELFATTPERTRAPWLIKFYLRQEDTERLVYASRDFEVPAKEREKYYHYVTLPAGAFVGRKFIFSTRLMRLERGKDYSLVVSYIVDDRFPYVIINRKLNSEQVDALGTKLAYVRVWTGQLISNRARFRVKRKKRLGIF